MTTFKGIRGTAIQVLSSDPSNPEVGQIWYNSSSGTLKGYQYSTVNAWASSNALPTARYSFGQAGPATATLIFGGQLSTGVTNTTLSYNGSSWTSVPATLGVTRNGLGGVGTQTAALAFGGGGASTPTSRTNSTESYNGSSWTAVNSMNTSRETPGSAGVQTAALAFGGFTSGPYPTGNTGATESWNGTSWTSVNSLNQPRDSLAGCGIQTSALAAGGQVGPPVANSTELWNGTSWTAIPGVLNTARGALGMFGVQTSAVAFGGATTPGAVQSATELFNGTSWTNNPTGLGTARTGFYGAGGSGTKTGTGLAVGGASPPSSALTNVELWSGNANQVKTITVS